MAKTQNKWRLNNEAVTRYKFTFLLFAAVLITLGESGPALADDTSTEVTSVESVGGFTFKVKGTYTLDPGEQVLSIDIQYRATGTTTWQSFDVDDLNSPIEEDVYTGVAGEFEVRIKVNLSPGSPSVIYSDMETVDIPSEGGGGM